MVTYGTGLENKQHPPLMAVPFKNRQTPRKPCQTPRKPPNTTKFHQIYHVSTIYRKPQKTQNSPQPRKHENHSQCQTQQTLKNKTPQKPTKASILGNSLKNIQRVMAHNAAHGSKRG